MKRIALIGILLVLLLMGCARQEFSPGPKGTVGPQGEIGPQGDIGPQGELGPQFGADVPGGLSWWLWLIIGVALIGGGIVIGVMITRRRTPSTGDRG